MEVKQVRGSFGEGSPEFATAKALIADVVVAPGKLRAIVHNDMALMIWGAAVADRVRWPTMRELLLKKGHTEADLEYVGERATKFALDIAMERGRLATGAAQRTAGRR